MSSLGNKPGKNRVFGNKPGKNPDLLCCPGNKPVFHTLLADIYIEEKQMLKWQIVAYLNT